MYDTILEAHWRDYSQGYWTAFEWDRRRLQDERRKERERENEIKQTGRLIAVRGNQSDSFLDYGGEEVEGWNLKTRTVILLVEKCLRA